MGRKVFKRVLAADSMDFTNQSGVLRFFDAVVRKKHRA